MRKRVLSILLALCLCVGLLPATALAAEQSEISDWESVSSVTLNENDGSLNITATDSPASAVEIKVTAPENSSVTITGQESTSYSNLYITVENQNITLNLINLDITAPMGKNGVDYTAAAGSTVGTGTLSVTGTCSITGGDNAGRAGAGVVGTNLDLIITGDGTLTIAGGAGTGTSGVGGKGLSTSKNITINAETTVYGGDSSGNAAGGMPAVSASLGTLTVNKSLKAYGGDSLSTGSASGGDGLSVWSRFDAYAAVEAQGGEGSTGGAGIRINNGGSTLSAAVMAIGGDGSRQASPTNGGLGGIGFYSGKDLIVNEVTFISTGGDGVRMGGPGLDAKGNVTMAGSTADIQGGVGVEDNGGAGFLTARNGDTTITLKDSAKVTVTGGDGTGDSAYGGDGFVHQQSSTITLSATDTELTVRGGDGGTTGGSGVAGYTGVEITGSSVATVTGGDGRSGNPGYGIQSSAIKVSGGTVLAQSDRQAMSVAPDISGYSSAKIAASTSYDGSVPSEYATENIADYKYLQISMVEVPEQFVALGDGNGSGIRLDANTPYYVNGSNSATGTNPESWNAYFDAATGTLYLNGLEISGYYKFHATWPYTAAIYSNGDLTISLTGESTVKNTASDLGNTAAYYGLNLWTEPSINHSLLVTSESQGVLNVSGPDSVDQNNAGIIVRNLTIQGDAVVNAAGGESTSDYSYGVSASGDITVAGNAQLLAVSSDAPKYISQGIEASSTLENTLTITDNAYVKASSGISSDISVNCGVYISILRMSGNGKLEAFGNTTGNMSCGVYARAGVVEISENASLYAKGGTVTGTITAWNGSYGIISVLPTVFFGGLLTMTGGTLTAVGEQGAIISQKPIDLENYDGSYTAQGSTQTDGSNLVDYNPATPKDYRYVSVRPKIEMPVASPNGGSFSDSQMVELSCATEGAEIYYTTDGTEPTTGSTKYTESFTITATTTVNAIAVKNANSSEVLTVTFTKSTGGGGYTPTYSITVEKAENGKVEANRSYASGGSTVTLTVTPEDGYVLDRLTVTDSQGNNIEATDKGNGTYTFKMPSRKVTVEAVFVPDGSFSTCTGGSACPIYPYTDADPAAWYHDGVHYCIDSGLMVGYGNNIFKPDASTTRGMIVTILYRLENEPTVSGACPFDDVQSNSWYEDAVTWAAANKIVDGYGDAKFGPEDNITREQMAAILYRYAQFKGYDVTASAELSSFTDAAQVSGWAQNAMQWACGESLIQGDAGKLMPTGNATRAQVAAILMRFIENIAK